jgi:hypothetical protein
MKNPPEFFVLHTLSLFVLGMGVLFCFSACEANRDEIPFKIFQGPTMGTNYSIVYQSDMDAQKLKNLWTVC